MAAFVISTYSGGYKTPRDLLGSLSLRREKFYQKNGRIKKATQECKNT